MCVNLLALRLCTAQIATFLRCKTDLAMAENRTVAAIASKRIHVTPLRHSTTLLIFCQVVQNAIVIFHHGTSRQKENENVAKRNGTTSKSLKEKCDSNSGSESDEEERLNNWGHYSCYWAQDFGTDSDCSIYCPRRGGFTRKKHLLVISPVNNRVQEVIDYAMYRLANILSWRDDEVSQNITRKVRLYQVQMKTQVLDSLESICIIRFPFAPNLVNDMNGVHGKTHLVPVAYFYEVLRSLQIKLAHFYEVLCSLHIKRLHGAPVQHAQKL